MKTIIYTSFDCLLRTPAADRPLQKNEHIEFASFPQKLYVYPTGKSGLIPFEIIQSRDSAFYKIIEKEDSTLVFLLDGIFVENVEIYSFQCGNVEISPRQITFLSKNSKKVLTLPAGSGDFKCGSFHLISYVTFATPEEQSLVCFNTKTNSARVFHAKEVEITKEGFILSTNGERRTLYVDKDGLKEKEVTHKNGAPPSNPFLVPTTFMECVKNRDYPRALSFLSPSLAQDEKAVKEFFGEISFIFTIDPKNVFAITNGNAKIFSFELANGRIVDIQD